MELYDEKVNETKSKTPTIIGICIVVLVIMTILIVFGIFYLKQSITVIQIDGQRNTEIEKIFYIESTEEGAKLYLPIVKTAKFLGYEGFNGDYLNKSEDKTKCHVTSENETAMFVKDSEILTKISKDSEIEYVTLDKPTFEKDGELYTTIKGIQNAFNISFSADQSFKNINIYTMDYLVQHYVAKLQIEKYSTEFHDKKAIFEDMIIIEDNNKYGVIKLQVIDGVLQPNDVLEAKYEEIRYLPVTKDFIVKSNGKYGIVTKEAVAKVRPVYDEIKTMDNQNGLYLVKQNGAYGVVNINGEVVIEPEYKQIGIDVNRYTQNGVDNSYVLLNEIIPIKNYQDLWALFNIEGERVTEFKYTGWGCTQSSASNSYPALVIPGYKVIVGIRDKHYTLVTTDGEQLVPDNTLNSVYVKTDAATEQNQYFMTYNNNEKVLNVEEWIQGTGR